MRTIHKFALASEGHVAASADAQIRRVGEQNGTLFAWIEVDPYKDIRSYRYRVVGTGHDIPEYLLYVDTVIMTSGFVWHVFFDPEAQSADEA